MYNIDLMTTKINVVTEFCISDIINIELLSLISELHNQYDDNEIYKRRLKRSVSGLQAWFMSPLNFSKRKELLNDCKKYSEQLEKAANNITAIINSVEQLDIRTKSFSQDVHSIMTKIKTVSNIIQNNTDPDICSKLHAKMSNAIKTIDDIVQKSLSINELLTCRNIKDMYFTTGQFNCLVLCIECGNSEEITINAKSCTTLHTSAIGNCLYGFDKTDDIIIKQPTENTQFTFQVKELSEGTTLENNKECENAVNIIFSQLDESVDIITTKSIHKILLNEVWNACSDKTPPWNE